MGYCLKKGCNRWVEQRRYCVEHLEYSEGKQAEVRVDDQYSPGVPVTKSGYIIVQIGQAMLISEQAICPYLDEAVKKAEEMAMKHPGARYHVAKLVTVSKAPTALTEFLEGK